jgi:magnesium transporter
VKAAPKKDVWVYGSRVTFEETAKQSQLYGLDNDIVRDIHDTQELPRLEYDKSDLYVFIRYPEKSEAGTIVTTPLLAVVTKSVYVTFSRTSYFLPTDLVNFRLNVSGADSRTMLLRTINAVVHAYGQFIHSTTKYTREIGDRLQTQEVSNRDFIKFVTIEENLNTYQTNLTGILAVLERLRDNKTRSPFKPDDLDEIDDSILLVNQMLVAVNGCTQSITSIRNTYSTVANNTLNQRIKTLTIITILITLPNVIFGMYGMNVPIPFQTQPWAYSAIIIFTVLSIIGAYVLVRRNKMF